MAQRNISRVVIVGCGIAGPALGLFLRRVGIDVVVCERRRSEAGDEGGFLGVAPNGMNVLAELGVRERIEASARRATAWSSTTPAARSSAPSIGDTTRRASARGCR
jgi:2-polyprenyl-6-methoxyphenol hydroxylase-like FAD-dependent oxidoreductase